MMAFRFLLAATCIAFVVFLFGAVLSIQVDWQSTQVQQGAIAALVVISGWLVTFAFREGTTIIDRVETARDVLSALLAEIEDYFDTLGMTQDDADAVVDAIRTSMEDAEKMKITYYPFLPSIPPVLVANRFSGELRSLPHNCVTPIVQFYATLADLQLMVEDTRHEHFREMSSDRRLLMFEDYVGTRLKLSECAYEAITAIKIANAQGFLGLSNRISAFSLGHALGVRKHGE